MAGAAFRVRCIRPLSSSQNAGADQIVRRPASPRSAFAGRGGGVCLHGGLRQDRHSIQVRMRTLLGIGGRQDRGVRSWRGPTLTGIRQGKLRRRIRNIKQNQWFAGVVQWQNGSFPTCEVRRDRSLPLALPTSAIEFTKYEPLQVALDFKVYARFNAASKFFAKSVGAVNTTDRQGGPAFLRSLF